jgi:hypothetical protein
MPMLPRVRALAAYKDFLTLWKDANPDLPSSSKPKPSMRGWNRSENSYPQIYPQRTVPTVPFSDLAAPAEIVSR